MALSFSFREETLLFLYMSGHRFASAGVFSFFSIVLFNCQSIRSSLVCLIISWFPCIGVLVEACFRTIDPIVFGAVLLAYLYTGIVLLVFNSKDKALIVLYSVLLTGKGMA